MRYGTQKHSIDILFILLIFAGFLLTAVLLVSMGTREYRGIVETMQKNSSLRTPQAYLMQAVRQNKDEDAVQIEEIDGVSTLAIRREIGGLPYTMRIYVYREQLMEMLTPEGNYDFTLAAGTRILPVRGLELEESAGGAVIARITDEYGRISHCLISAEP